MFHSESFILVFCKYFFLENLYLREKKKINVLQRKRGTLAKKIFIIF